jgi:hypothetical protein
VSRPTRLRIGAGEAAWTASASPSPGRAEPPRARLAHRAASPAARCGREARLRRTERRAELEPDPGVARGQARLVQSRRAATRRAVSMVSVGGIGAAGAAWTQAAPGGE